MLHSNLPFHLGIIVLLKRRYDSTDLCIFGLDDNIESLEPLVAVRGAPLEVDRRG